jgi:hypothetical protein
MWSKRWTTTTQLKREKTIPGRGRSKLGVGTGKGLAKVRNQNPGVRIRGD